MLSSASHPSLLPCSAHASACIPLTCYILLSSLACPCPLHGLAFACAALLCYMRNYSSCRNLFQPSEEAKVPFGHSGS